MNSGVRMTPGGQFLYNAWTAELFNINFKFGTVYLDMFMALSEKNLQFLEEKVFHIHVK